jgi:DNA-binding MarR family transcriptional regulator
MVISSLAAIMPPWREKTLITGGQFSRATSDRYGMTRPEWRAIAIIGACSEVTAAQIRDDSTMHKTMVSRAVSALEKRRWVARAPVAGASR